MPRTRKNNALRSSASSAVSASGRIWLALLSVALAGYAAAQERPIPPSELKSGAAFASADLRALQADEFGNPGMLWVERGERLWGEAAGAAARSCASCHQDARTTMKGVAARYPLFDPKARRLLNVEGRINPCPTERQRAEPLRYESEELLALTAYVAHQSRGMPMAVSIDGPARVHFEAGERLYHA